MSKNIDKTLDSSSSKALLYSELLNTSVTGHVYELLQKKKTSSTFHVGRSSVLGKVSKLLQSFKETENDVKNIEIVEEGEPVIDMSVTLIDRDVENGCESDDDTRNEDSENEANDRINISSDSDNDVCEVKVSGERNVPISAGSESELSENEINDDVLRNLLPYSDVDITGYKKCLRTIINAKNVISSDSDDTQECEDSAFKETKLLSNTSNSEPFDNKFPEEHRNNNKFQDSDCDLLDQENFLEHTKLDLEVPDPTSKYHSGVNNCDLSGKMKRKLISVIEEVDEQRTSSTKQKKL